MDGAADAAVIEASLRDGDQFAVLYDRYAAKLYRYAYRRVGREAAEDVVADCFMVAFRQRHRYVPERPTALPWLFGILTKELARRHRRERAHYRALARMVDGDASDGLADHIVASVSAQACRAALAEALSRLPARDRDVLLLVAWGDLSYEEVAQALRLPVGTVRSRLHRARHKIRTALGGVDPST
jgi:RNA polymerase sigma factor (sigma-70 family)